MTYSLQFHINDLISIYLYGGHVVFYQIFANFWMIVLNSRTFPFKYIWVDTLQSNLNCAHYDSGGRTEKLF